MRGTPKANPTRAKYPRIIPAHAGNTHRWVYRRPDAGDHPRTCGEHHRQGQGRRETQGIIPAHAGNTYTCCCSCLSSWDHPRTCGEHYQVPWRGFSRFGSSPHMRGTHATSSREHRYSGIIPAHAGNTWPGAGRCEGSWDHPRTCGEHPRHGWYYRWQWGSSPHMRGTQFVCRQQLGAVRIIPAHAGNTTCGQV